MYSSDQQYSVDHLSTLTNKPHEYCLGSQYSVDRLSTSTNKQHKFGLGSQLQQYSVDRLSTLTNKQHEFGLGSQLTNKNLLSPPNVTVAHKQYSFLIKDNATYATHKRKTNSIKNNMAATAA